MNNQLSDSLKKELVGHAKRILDELKLLFSVDVSFDDSPEVHAAAEIQAGLKLVAREIGDKMRSIESDHDLSSQGRVKRFAALADAVRPRLQALEKAILPKLRAKLDTLRGELAAPMPPLRESDAAGAIRQMEIRNRLSDLDDASRLAALWRAVEVGDAAVLAAFSTAPLTFPLVDAEALSEAMAAHWRQQRPDTAEQVESTEMLVETLTGYFRRLTHVLDNLSGIIENDPAESVNVSDGSK